MCSSSNSGSSSKPEIASGNRSGLVIVQNLEKEIPQDDHQAEITTSIFNKIELRIVGIPQEAFLQNKMQMKRISETKRKLEQSKVDPGENSAQEDYVYTKETAEKIHDQGNVELVELRQRTETIQACWKHT